jgi:uncharacterized protein
MTRIAPNHRSKASFWLAFVASAAVLTAARGWSDPAPEPLSRFPTGTVRVTGKHPTRRFKVWLAATDARREQGLMFVRSMEPDQGMWFQFDTPDILTFWMKNTYIPLDILYVAADGRIVRIAAQATPFSLTPIPSGAPATAVLELGGGIAEANGIRVGDHATFQ